MCSGDEGDISGSGRRCISDNVPKSILLDKLSSCEINWFTLHFVMNWLNGRAQSVAVSGTMVNSHSGSFPGLSSRSSSVQQFYQWSG